MRRTLRGPFYAIFPFRTRIASTLFVACTCRHKQHTAEEKNTDFQFAYHRFASLTANIQDNMLDNWPHLLLFMTGFIAWVLSATPVLTHMVFLAEKDFRWPLITWFIGITAAIFLMKFSLLALTSWPEPSSWASRFFYPVWLFSSPLVPYLNEVRKSGKR
jgi:hypothetical protein